MRALKGAAPDSAVTEREGRKGGYVGKTPHLFKPQTSQSQAALELQIGRRSTGIVVEPDLARPGQWRVPRGDDLSDHTNFTRAKDAALRWACPRGLGGSEDFRWRCRETALGAPPLRRNGRAS